MALSGEDASLKELLENASSVLTACQNTSTIHQPKNGARHSKKHIKTVTKESKGAKKRRPISTNGLAMDWTDEEEEEETCDIENIPPVSQRDSEHPLLKPFYNMISFSSDSDSSPQLPCPRSKLHQQTYGEKSLCDQKHQHLTERRMKCKKREESSSEPGSTFMDSREFDAGSTQNCGKGEKVKSSRAETMQNCAGTIEDDTKPKNNSARTMQKGANNHHLITRALLGSIKKQNTDLHGLFDVASGSDSSSEFDATSVSVTCLMNGDASGSDSEDFGGLSDQLAQVLSISTCRRMPRKQPKRRGEDAMPGKENASLAAEGELGSLHDQRPLLKSKRKILSKNSKKSSNGTCSPDPTCHKLHVGLGKTPAGSADESNRSGTSDFSVNDDEVLPETKEISLQVSLSANSETSPETSIGEGSVRSKTASTPEEIFDRREDSENCMSKKVTTRHSEEDSLCSVEEGMHVEVMSQHDSLHSEDISHNDGITTDFIDNEIEPTTRDFSLQVSIGSTELSDSEYDLSLPEKDPSDNRQHLPTVQNCSLQVSVSSSNATDSLLVFPGGKENGQAVSIGDGKCLPCTNSEKMRFCQGHMTSCDSDANLKKQLFPGSTLQSPVHYRGLSPSMWDSGFGEIRCSTASDKGTHKTQASFGSDTNRSEGASCIDHSVDKTDPPRLSLSPEDSSHDNHVGTGKDRKDQDLDNEWLPDLDSSSDESDLEAFFQEMKTPKVKKTVKDLPSMDVFIVNDSDVSSDDDSTLYVTAVEPKSHSFVKRSVLDSVFVTPCLPPLRRKASTTVKKSVSSRHYGLGDDVTMATGQRLLDRVRHVERPHSTGHVISQASFLRSLDQDMDNNRRHPEAARYVKHFKKVKEELTAHLFKLYNKTVFAHKLPEDMSITWNKRLIKTAGFCAYSKRVATPADRKVRIELSVKVCDAAERVRDTLIHELCHAAVWFLNGVNDGHGPHWKYWAHAACHVHPELPAIKRCHKYEITHKYTYKCTKCGYEIGRHSKSLDTKAKVCGYCHSPFALVTKSAATPRTPNKFALFVKENYGSMKRDNNTHKDVMRMLSSDFARQNSISASRGQKEL